MKLKDFYKKANEILEDLCETKYTLSPDEIMNEAVNTLNQYYSKNFPCLKAIKGNNVSGELITILDYKNKYHENQICIFSAFIYDDHPCWFIFYKDFSFDFDLFLTSLFFPELFSGLDCGSWTPCPPGRSRCSPASASAHGKGRIP